MAVDKDQKRQGQSLNQSTPRMMSLVEVGERLGTLSVPRLGEEHPTESRASLQKSINALPMTDRRSRLGLEGQPLLVFASTWRG